jgi:curved DNA-binding protein
MPEYDEHGRMRRVARNFKARIPPGVSDGERLRLRGQGGKGVNGGRDGDLYINVSLRPHPIYRVSGRDVYVELPLAPWEAVLGTSVELPTLGGPVRLKIRPGTQSGQQLRLAKKGLPKPGNEGDLYAVVQIAVPHSVTDEEKAQYEKLAEVSKFDPRAHLKSEMNK